MFEWFSGKERLHHGNPASYYIKRLYYRNWHSTRPEAQRTIIDIMMEDDHDDEPDQTIHMINATLQRFPSDWHPTLLREYLVRRLEFDSQGQHHYTRFANRFAMNATCLKQLDEIWEETSSALCQYNRLPLPYSPSMPQTLCKDMVDMFLSLGILYGVAMDTGIVLYFLSPTPHVTYTGCVLKWGIQSMTIDLSLHPHETRYFVEQMYEYRNVLYPKPSKTYFILLRESARVSTFINESLRS